MSGLAVVGAAMLVLPFALFVGSIVIAEHRRGEHMMLAVVAATLWVVAAMLMVSIGSRS